MVDSHASQEYPWAAGSATGVGSLPGDNPAEAMRLVFGELPDLPHLAELPGRGPGADLTGRTAALLVDLPVEITSSGWRFAARPGRDLSRARGMLSADLDALEEVASGYQGPLKIQVCGPWTLAATIELARSQDPALADAGALADLTESLREGVCAHASEVCRRAPGARLLVQFDEPRLPAVIAGSVPTASGLNRLPAPEAAEVTQVLRDVISAVPAFTVVRCSALPVPFGVIKNAGAQAVGFDLGLLRRDDEEALAEAVEAGLAILAGAVPAVSGAGATGPPSVPSAGAKGSPAGETAAGRGVRSPAGQGARGAAATPDRAERAGTGQPPTGRQAAERVIDVWRRMGWPARPGATGPAGVPSQVVLTPAGGLAGVSPGYARAVLARCAEAARLLPELIEEERR